MLDLAALRIAKGKTVADFAGDLDVSAQAIRGWESGDYFPEPFRVADVAKQYGVKVGELASHISQSQRAKRMTRKAGA